MSPPALSLTLKARICRYPKNWTLEYRRIAGSAGGRDEEADRLLNPSVIVEVLSLSKETFDRGKKLDSYRTIPSLQE